MKINSKKGEVMEKINFKRSIFLSIILISLGVTMNTLIKEGVTAVGTVFIAVGGLFFIIGMAAKKKAEEKAESKE